GMFTQEVVAMNGRWRVCAVGLAGLLTLLAPSPSLAQGVRRAQIVVILPSPDAELTISGAATKQTGPVRRFTSPALQPGRKYTYTLVATWEPNNYTKLIRTRDFTVEAGKTTRADMREADPDQPDRIIARFVPTPDDIVEAMCRLAKVGKDDVVYDLGC